MKRILIEASARPWLLALGVGLASLALSTSATAEPAEPAERAVARAHFDRGLALARERDYARALLEFQRAYEVSPHFSVLYNIARAELALNRRAQALTTLQRYLDEAGDRVEPPRKAEVEALLVRLRSELEAAEQPPPSASEPSATAQPDPTDADAAKSEARQSPRPSAAAPSTGRTQPPVDLFASTPARNSPTPRSDAQRSIAYVLGGAGLVLSGAALGHFLWNRSRYQDWQEQYAAYYDDPTDRRRESANRLSDSISRASVASVALAVGAGLALGTGTVLLLTSAPATADQRAQARPFIQVEGRFE
jgi:tetratricopeptide (TPR) repeat protein